MTCCGGNVVAERIADESVVAGDHLLECELRHSGHKLSSGEVQYIFTSPSIHCGSCIRIIEHELSAMAGVAKIRVNLTLKRVVLNLDSEEISPLPYLRKLNDLGFPAHIVEPGSRDEALQRLESAKILRAMAVAGFSAMNIMLLSVSTWSGADGATRDLFHLISALIAIPTIAYSGQVFFNSAYKALRNGHLNMDVPISLAVLLALGMSLFETFNRGDVAYFDAAVSLLFFLLIGRYLDQIMRARARNAVLSLSRLAAKGANIVKTDGKTEYLPIDEIEPGMCLRILPGDKIPVDGTIVKGISDFDLSLVTGESVPVTRKIGDELLAGTQNLTGVIELNVLRPAARSYLAEITQMLAAAENGRGAYVQIADRMAQLYAPAVHLLALAAFASWMILTGGDWHQSLYISIAVLIITCPCALGLAVPVVHVIGATRLFEKGILMKDGSALERLAETDHVIFDKTGTLTQSLPVVAHYQLDKKSDADLISMLAAHSSHPASRAVAALFDNALDEPVSNIREFAGKGVEGDWKGKRLRLGKCDWVSDIASKTKSSISASQLCFAVEGHGMSEFTLGENIREGALAAIGNLKKFGYDIEIMSGDGFNSVSNIAGQLGIESFKAEQSPGDKIETIYELQKNGKHVLMVGDGLNDAPSLAAGHASMAPASASDVGRQAADFVFTRDSLEAVPEAVGTAIRARKLIKQNFALAIGYNCIAVPLAFTGYVTPLFAAVAMSASSIVVVLNSMRLAYEPGKSNKQRKTALTLQSMGKAS